jgi:hypothetical protein
MAYKIGIMMIGSLYWERSDVRVNWRENRLADEQYAVLAPIRYGRLSETRGNTYTMVFSKLCARKSYGLGSAKVVTCKNNANNIEGIIEEAQLLWAAERNENNTNNKFWASWGSIGLLCNPRTTFPANYFSSWTNMTENSRHYGNVSHAKSETPVISKDGFLKLPWPVIKNQGKHLALDIVLATATDPTLDINTRAYPKTKVIAEAWKNDNGSNDNYFLKNRKYGIHTFQDKTISNMMK